MSKDAISDLSAVTLARYDIERMPEGTAGRDAALITCNMFISEAARRAANQPSFLVEREKHDI
jgi:hypothetical protein